tara:strand:- start:145 stop:312 length:168 start_codon:yes stop_codon:yes gene_type:complete
MMEKIAAMLLFMSFLFVLYFSIMVSINKSFDEALDNLFTAEELHELAWSGLHDKK